MSTWSDISQTAAQNPRYSPQVRNDRYGRYSSADIFAAASPSFKDDLHSGETTSTFDCKNLHVNEQDSSSRTGGPPKWRSKRVEELKRQNHPSWEYHSSNSLDSHISPKRPEQWWYTDPTGACQGPFHYSKMQEWYIQGFFKSHLPIRCNENTPFIPLGQWFGSKNPAFLDEVPPNWKEATQHADKQVAHAMEEKLEDKPSTDEGEHDTPKQSEILEKYSTSQASEHQPAPIIETSRHMLYQTAQQTMLPAPIAEPLKKDDLGQHSVSSNNDWWVNPTTATFSNENWQRKLHHNAKVPESSSLQSSGIMSSPAILESQPSSLGGGRAARVSSSRLQHPAPLAYNTQHTPMAVEFRSALKSLGYDSVSKPPLQEAALPTPQAILQAPVIKKPPPIHTPLPQQYAVEKKIVPQPVQPQLKEVRPIAHVPTMSESQGVQVQDAHRSPVAVAQPRKSLVSSWTQQGQQRGHQKTSLVADELRIAKQRSIGSQRQNHPLSWSQRMKPAREKPAVALRQPPLQQQRTGHQVKCYENNPKTRNPSITSGSGWGNASSGNRIQPTRQTQKSRPKNSKTEGGKKKSRSTHVQPVTNLENPFGKDWQKMSSEFNIWCKNELTKLSKGSKAKNNFTDFTDLIKFLMSLSSEDETRDMIIQYLGNTPKVQNFADGFLLRKCFTMDEYAQAKGDHENMVQKAGSRSKRKKKWRQE